MFVIFVSRTRTYTYSHIHITETKLSLSLSHTLSLSLSLRTHTHTHTQNFPLAIRDVTYCTTHPNKQKRTQIITYTNTGISIYISPFVPIEYILNLNVLSEVISVLLYIIIMPTRFFS